MEDSYLVDEPAEANEFIQKLNQLLITNDDTNIELVFQILKGGGVPRILYENLVNSPLKKLLCLKYEFSEPLSLVKGLALQDNCFALIQNLKALGYLINLEYLDLEGLGLAKIPIEIQNLKKIRILNLKYNQISYIPTALVDLSKLQKLYLDYNLFETLPDCISNFSNLEYLTLASNKITHLPDSIAQLKKLRKLVLWNNPISAQEIKRCRELLPHTQIKIRP
jgi:hypothetical protein